jgi:rubrerythrin
MKTDCVWELCDRVVDMAKWRCGSCGNTWMDDCTPVFQYCPFCGNPISEFIDTERDMSK